MSQSKSFRNDQIANTTYPDGSILISLLRGNVAMNPDAIHQAQTEHDHQHE